jgi:hypothetical protein
MLEAMFGKRMLGVFVNLLTSVTKAKLLLALTFFLECQLDIALQSLADIPKEC